MNNTTRQPVHAQPRDTGQGNAAPLKKSEVTREKILEAAGRVFALHEYNAASIRMVAREGGFGHGIIRYYYPSKADLFRAVLNNVCEALYEMTVFSLEETRRMPPRDGLTRYMELLLTFNAEKPEALRILVQNMALRDSPASTPGHDRIIRLLTDTRHAFEEKLNLRSPSEKVRMFLDSFNGLMLYYLGASPCQAGILGVDPAGREYQDWVRDTMVSVFLPLLESLTAGSAKPGARKGRSTKGSLHTG